MLSLCSSIEASGEIVKIDVHFSHLEEAKPCVFVQPELFMCDGLTLSRPGDARVFQCSSHPVDQPKRGQDGKHVPWHTINMYHISELVVKPAAWNSRSSDAGCQSPAFLFTLRPATRRELQLSEGPSDFPFAQIANRRYLAFGISPRLLHECRPTGRAQYIRRGMHRQTMAH